MTRKQIFILGSYHGNNFGDMEILDSLILKFYKNFKLSILSKDRFKLKSKLASQYFEDGDLKFISPFNIFKVLNHIIKSDVVLIGGGGLFFSYSILDTLRIAGKSQILYWVVITIISKILGKKIYWFGVGIGPLDNFGKLLVRIGLKFVNKLYVRDELSLKFVKGMIQPSKSELISDIVFSKLEDRKIKKNLEKNNQYKNILLIFFDKSNTKKLEALISKLRGSNFKVSISSTNPDKDSKFNQELAKKLKVGFIDTQNFSLIEFRNMFNKFDLVVSMRMHALLIAYQQGLLGVGLNDGVPKVKELQNQLYSPTELYSDNYEVLEPIHNLIENHQSIKLQSIKNYQANYILVETAFEDLLSEIKK